MTGEQFELEAKALRPSLIATAAKILGSRDEAEDVVQDVLVKLWHTRGTLTSPLAPPAVTAARNAAIDRLRRIKAHPTTELTPACDTAPEPTDNERALRMEAIIDTLPSAQQQVLRMRLANGAEYSEIATAMDMSEQNVRQILSRARKAVLMKYSKR